jgi:hypothetical protein
MCQAGKSEKRNKSKQRQKSKQIIQESIEGI